MKIYRLDLTKSNANAQTTHNQFFPHGTRTFCWIGNQNAFFQKSVKLSGNQHPCLLDWRATLKSVHLHWNWDWQAVCYLILTNSGKALTHLCGIPHYSPLALGSVADRQAVSSGHSHRGGTCWASSLPGAQSQNRSLSFQIRPACRTWSWISQSRSRHPPWCTRWANWKRWGPGCSSVPQSSWVWSLCAASPPQDVCCYLNNMHKEHNRNLLNNAHRDITVNSYSSLFEHKYGRITVMENKTQAGLKM